MDIGRLLRRARSRREQPELPGLDLPPARPPLPPRPAPGSGAAADERKLSWLALSLALWDRPAQLRKLLDRFPDPDEALRAGAAGPGSAPIDAGSAAELRRPDLRARAQKEFDRLGRKGYSLLTLEDAGYPSDLREAFDPPCVLYCAGRPEASRGPAVAVVGSRNPTPYGSAVAERLAGDLATRGVVIVSGLALGIDTAAHWGALRAGRTVAVLGSGLENVYPRENRKLFEAIGGSGVVVSEFPLDAPPLSHHFPRRNRVISGLSRAVVVVEAASRSGSLVTAALALDQNREVMAVPGNVTSDLSRGANGLIKAGAKLVEGWEDVAEELPSPLRETLLARSGPAEADLPPLAADEAEVLGLLRPDAPARVDELAERSGRPVAWLLAILLELEIKGRAARGPGQTYLRRW